MDIFLYLDQIPRTTAQQKRVRIVNGKPHFYDGPKIKEARQLLISNLQPYAPAQPLQGPVSLSVTWYYPSYRSNLIGSYKTTRPDLDNTLKILCDALMSAGFLVDDAQIVNLSAKKCWGDPSGISISINSIKELSPDEIKGGTII